MFENHTKDNYSEDYSFESASKNINNKIIFNKNNFFYSILFLLVFALILILDVFFILMPDKETSETENRALQQFPKFNVTTVTNGKFESKFDTYVADQFPLRDEWVAAKSYSEILSGKTESNNIFLGKDGYLIQNYTLPTEETYQENINEIRNLKANHPELNFNALVAPTALSILKDKLPMNAQTTDEEAFFERVKADLLGLGINFIDVRDSLKQLATTSQVYYRTDHHWTTDAAYTAYLQMANQLDLPGKETVYSPKIVSDSFKGTLSASSGFRTAETDPLFIYWPVEPQDYVVNYVSEGKVTASFYDSSALEHRDHYSLFFNGNHPQVKIATDAPSSKNLLIIKDSFANCFIPFLEGDYKKIIMIDPRYYTEDIDSLIKSEKITDVLYLNNISTFAE